MGAWYWEKGKKTENEIFSCGNDDSGLFLNFMHYHIRIHPISRDQPVPGGWMPPRAIHSTTTFDPWSLHDSVSIPDIFLQIMES